MKHTVYLLAGSFVLLAACGETTKPTHNDEAAVNSAQPEKKPAYCFFKDDEMKGWKAARDRHGDISVDGQAHVKDPRYKATFGKVEVGPQKVILDLSITENDLGYAMRDNWWHVGMTAPNSASLTEAVVQCGDKIVADLKVPQKG
jgi:hypothetical protein